MNQDTSSIINANEFNLSLTRLTPMRLREFDFSCPLSTFSERESRHNDLGDGGKRWVAFEVSSNPPQQRELREAFALILSGSLRVNFHTNLTP